MSDPRQVDREKVLSEIAGLRASIQHYDRLLADCRKDMDELLRQQNEAKVRLLSTEQQLATLT